MTLLQVLGGLALFLFGLAQVAEHLQTLAGSALQRLLRRAREAPWLGVGVGAAVTAAAQSATAVGVMTASLIRGGTLRSREALAVMLGAAIGGTIAVQLVSLNVTAAAVPLVAIGFGLTLVKSRGARALGAALLGLGLALLGLALMIDALAPLREARLVREVLAGLSSAPLALVCIGFALTLVLHSSNAPVVLAMAMVSAGVLGLPAALAVMLGANLGTPANIHLMTLGQGVEVKRAAIAHLCVKAVATVALLPLLEAIARALPWLEADAARALANGHSLFNLLVALVALPLLGAIDRRMQHLFPDPPANGPRAKYLDHAALQSPDLAYGLAFREMSRVADHVLRMARAAFDARDAESAQLERVKREEEVVDSLVNQLVLYLGRLHDRLPPDRLQALLSVCTALEGIGDLLRRLLRQRNKLWARGLALSTEGQQEIDRVARETLDRAREMLTALSMGDLGACERHVGVPEPLATAIQASRLAHLGRLHADRDESILTSTVHLDILTLLEQINTELDNIARRAAAAFSAAPAGTVARARPASMGALGSSAV
jgi:phosphate:Na+ symporter